MDPLSDVLSLLKLHSYACGGFDVGADLCLQFPKHAGIKCYAVVSGQGWLSVEGGSDPVQLKAGDKLVNSTDPVSVISLSLGYESEAAFSTAFTRVMGCSPRQYGRGDRLEPVAH